MTKLTKCFSSMALFLSFSAVACHPMESMSVEVIKQTLNPVQIQASLNKWKTQELEKIASTPTIQFQHDIAPVGAREALARSVVETKYNEMVLEFGLQ
ncbi:hypothetical protein ACHELK_004103 [Vibrio vulnificus]